jgi:hypothetical protein
MNAHEWIEVKGRRWCIGCDAMQRMAHHALGLPSYWQPDDVPAECPRNTFAAREADGLTTRGKSLTRFR